MLHNSIILGLQRCTIVFLIEVRVTILILHKFALLIAFSFHHFEVKLVFIFEICLFFEFVDHIFLLVVVLSSLLVILLLLEQTEMSSVC